ncbi:MAG: CpaE family protein, partial [Actinomyces dentalis]
MSPSPARRGADGVLLALTGEDAAIVRALDAAGSGLSVVRRCGDVAELLSAALAGLARLAVLDTGFDDLDRTVLDRLERCGVAGVLLVDDDEERRWAAAGWATMSRRADPAMLRARLQLIARRGGGEAALALPPARRHPPGSPPDTGAETAQPREGRLAVVWGPHGAPGRTTVAASLAHGLARAGGSVLVDADVEAPSLVQVLGLPEDSSSLATAARLASHSRLDTESLVGLLVPVGPDHSLLSGLGRSGRWRELPPSPMADVWAGCREVAAWTVVDIAGGPLEDEVDDYTLEPGRDALAASLVRSADVVVIVGAADPVGVRRLLQLVGQFDEGERPAGRIEVVVNRVRASAAGPSPERAVREALARFGGLEEVTLLPEDPVADQCLLAGCSVLDGAPGSALGRALAVLVDRVDPAAGARRAASRQRRRGFLRRWRERHSDR